MAIHKLLEIDILVEMTTPSDNFDSVQHLSVEIDHTESCDHTELQQKHFHDLPVCERAPPEIEIDY